MKDFTVFNRKNQKVMQIARKEVRDIFPCTIKRISRFSVNTFHTSGNTFYTSLNTFHASVDTFHISGNTVDYLVIIYSYITAITYRLLAGRKAPPPTPPHSLRTCGNIRIMHLRWKSFGLRLQFSRFYSSYLLSQCNSINT